LAGGTTPAAGNGPASGMPAQIRVACPGCGHHYRVVAEHAGKRLRCRHCQNIVPIPGPPSF
jgi:ribosomal protein S27E